MIFLSRCTAIAVAAAFALAALEIPGEARERSGVTQTRQAKKARVHRRAAQRPMPYAAAAAPVAAYAAPHAMMPYGGPGRAQFEPIVVGAQPERGEDRSPEGP